MMPATRPMRTVLFSTLYPSVVRPNHGIFVETRLRHLLGSGEVDTRVVAPVPWFPSRHARFGRWAEMARTPAAETRNGIRVLHPRYLLPPRVGMTVAPLTLALGARATLARLQREGFDFDLIDAHYYYPDGVAAALLGHWFGKPVVITARGTDLNLIPAHALPRRWIRWAESHAAASVGVCRALMDELVRLGGRADHVHVLRNGVDLQRFVPLPQAEARRRLGLADEGTWLLSVGHLVERKGHHLAIEALAALPGMRLAIVGEGEARDALQRQTARLGLSGRVHFAGARPQDELKDWYSAADALLLCSSREGWANVLLEAMACGTPVVATPIWGTPEVVQVPAAGRLMRERSAAALVEALQALLADYPARAAVRAYAEGFDWAATTRGQLALFRTILGDAPQAAAAGVAAPRTGGRHA